MAYIRERVLQGEFMAGAWLNLASPITVEMAASVGYDWVLLDQEHGPGDNMTLLHQMHAVQAGPAAPIVRIAWNEMPRFKRALDLGAMGIMIPYVQNRQEALYAVNAMRYFPQGVRGVASSPRAAGYGASFNEYYEQANDSLLTVTQIESREAVANLDEIATVDGVDVLFVGPLDLSISLGTPKRFDDPEFKAVLAKIAKTAKAHGKAAGILIPGLGQLEMVREMGFTFVAANTDGGMVLDAMKLTIDAMSSVK